MTNTITTGSMQSDLLSSTALSTSGHKGGLFKTAIAIAIAVAIPIAAPAIAGSIGLSSAIGTTFGSALVGAGLGAASGFALGTDPLIGAVGGGIGGGIGGYNYTPTGAESAAAGGWGTSPGGEFAGSPTTTGGAVGSNPAGLVSDPSAISFGADGQPPVVGGSGVDSIGAVQSQPGLGDVLSGSGTPAAPGEFAGLSVPSTGTPSFNAPASSTIASGPTVSGGTPQSFTDRVGNWVNDIPGKLSNAAENVWESASDGKLLTQTAIKLGAQGAVNAFTGSPDMSDQEKALMAQQERSLALQAQQAADAYAAQKEGSDALLREASYYDPNYTGAQAYAADLNRRKRQEEDALRKINPREQQRRTATERRYDLDTARSSSAAFDRGYQGGRDNQTRLISAGLQNIPKADPSIGAAIRGNQSSAADYYTRLQRERENASDMFTPIVAGVFGGDSEEEKRKRELS